MTNREIKTICIETQTNQTNENYPAYKFKVTQNKSTINIFWEYLDGECWTIEKETLLVNNEHGEFMNESFDYNETLEEVIKGSVYYMVTRY